MEYLINTNTNRILKTECFSKFFRTEPWRTATQEEIDNFNFEKNKNEIIVKSKDYLKNTDWMSLKNLELLESNYTTEIANRVFARTAINQAEIATIQTELDNIDLAFLD